MTCRIYLSAAITCLFWTLTVSQCPTGDGYHQYGNSCYRVYGRQAGEFLTKAEAENRCQTDDPRFTLALVESENEQNFLHSILQNTYQFDKTYIEGYEQTTDNFVWIADNQELVGSVAPNTPTCYFDNTRTFLQVPISASNNVTAEFCAEYCKEKQQNYVYAGVRIYTTDYSECFCGTTIPDNAQVISCNVECPNNPGHYCGATDGQGNYNGINVIEIQYGNPVVPAYEAWVPGQPNNLDGYQYCAQIDDFFNSHKWNDEFCFYARAYLCQYPLSSSACTGTGYTYAANKCFKGYLDQKNFFEARYSCVQMGGALMKIDTEEIQEAVKTYVNTLDMSQKYWFGLTRSRFLTSENSGVDLTYTKFAGEEPNGANDKCLAISRNAGGPDLFQWDDVNCASQFPFVCKYTLPTSSTSPTTTPTTTTTVSTPTSTQTLPPSTATTTTTSTTTTTTTTVAPSTSTIPPSPAMTTTTTMAPSTSTMKAGTTPSVTPGPTPGPTPTTPTTTSIESTTPANATIPSAQEDEELLPKGVIVAIVVSCTCVLVGFIRLVVYCCQRSAAMRARATSNREDERASSKVNPIRSYDDARSIPASKYIARPMYQPPVSQITSRTSYINSDNIRNEVIAEELNEDVPVVLEPPHSVSGVSNHESFHSGDGSTRQSYTSAEESVAPSEDTRRQSVNSGGYSNHSAQGSSLMNND